MEKVHTSQYNEAILLIKNQAMISSLSILRRFLNRGLYEGSESNTNSSIIRPKIEWLLSNEKYFNAGI
jgi:hypothetical protein